MNIRGKLLTLSLAFGLIATSFAGIIVWNALRITDHVELVEASLEDLRLMVDLRSTTQFFETRQYLTSDTEMKEKALEKLRIDVEASLERWIEDVKIEKRHNVQKKEEHLIKARYIKEKYNEAFEIYIKALELTKEGDTEEAFRIIKKNAEPLVHDVLFKEIGGMIDDQLEIVHDIYHELLSTIGVMPWNSKKGMEQIRIAQSAVNYFMAIDKIRTSINEQIRAGLHYLVSAEEESREDFEKSGTEIRKAFTALRHTIQEQPSLGVESEKEDLENAGRLENIYNKASKVLGETLVLKNAGKTEKMLGNIEHVEPLFIDALFPGIDDMIEDSNQEMDEAHNNLLRFIYTSSILGICIEGIIIVLIISFLLRLTKGMIGSLNELSKGAEKFGEGDLEHRVELNSRDEFQYLASSFNDMAESLQYSRKKTLSDKTYMDNILNSMDEGLFVITMDMCMHIKKVNISLCRMLHYTAEELLEKPVKIIVESDFLTEEDQLDELFGKGHIKNIEAVLHTKNDVDIPVLFSASIMRLDPHNQQIVCLALDITERKKMLEKLSSMSISDELTGLLNRRGFFTLAQQQLNIAKRSQKEMLLLFTDLDGLKKINDNFGHQEGDLALIETADLLKKSFRQSDIIARLGGDEFAVLLLDVSQFTDEKILNNHLQKKIQALNSQRSRGYKLSISVGGAVYDPKSPCSLDELLSRADALMYEQKKRKPHLNIVTDMQKKPHSPNAPA